MAHQYEAKRLEALKNLDLLDTGSEPEIDCITDGVRRLFGCKIALVSLVDDDRQWFKAKCGITVEQTPRDIAFCAHAVAADDILIVPDATLDARFRDNPLVRGAPHVRMYVGMPLRVPASDGQLMPIGTLCAIDDRARMPAADTIEQLRTLAKILQSLLQLRRIGRESLKLALERNEAALAADRAKMQLLQAERMANIGSWRLDLATSKVAWSDQTYAIHGLPPGTGEGLPTALDFYPPAERQLVLEGLAACQEDGRPYDLEVDFIDAQGRLRRVRAIGELERHDGHPVAIIGVFQDVTESYRKEQMLREAALTDELTRLPGRRYLNDSLDVMIDQAQDSGESLAVAIVDLDHFKRVNDRFGHAAGDDVLRGAAARLRDAPYFSGHFAARLGGDEFVLVLRSKDAETGMERGLQRLSEDLRQSVGAGAAMVQVSATIGVARLGGIIRSRAALLAAADAALYQAKEARRGTMKIAA